MNKAIELALLTWYPPDHPKYKDPEHPTEKLAGESGELLDLYSKNKNKPSVDWWHCKHCGLFGPDHFLLDSECNRYSPKVMEELGDRWYYLRILAWIKDHELKQFDYYDDYTLQQLLVESNLICAKVAYDWEFYKNIEAKKLDLIYSSTIKTLDLLSSSLGELTEYNYRKLNSEPTHHGWRDAQ